MRQVAGVVVGVGCNSALQAAEEAVAWAKLPSDADPSMTNYERLCREVLDAVRAGRPGGAVASPDMPGLAAAYWPCLSRMLVMDDPGLVGWIRPRYAEALDCQAGTAWLQIMFADVTGRRPLARSWRHAGSKAVSGR